MDKKLLFLLILLFLVSCSPKYYEKSADREVYEIIKDKKEKIKNEKMPIKLNEETNKETIILSLKDALILSANKNRDYQAQKENVYLSVLNLTYQRYLFKPRFTFTGDITFEKDSEEKISSDLNLNLIKILSTGVQLTFDISETILKYLSGDKEKSFQSITQLNLLQPILKGAGRKIVLENLIQSERDTVYKIREFLRYQKSFSIDITRDYLNLLLYKKRMENYYTNYLNLKETRERIEMLSEAGRIPPFQVDQAKQNEYNAYQRYITAQNLYYTYLDSFKIKLGLPPSVVLILNDSEIENLFNQKLPEIKIDLEEFTEYALEHRLDLITEYEQLEDKKRKVEIAKNNLLNQLNLEFGIKSTGDEKEELNIDLNKPEYNIGLDLKIPFNKIPERNEYKKALIEFDRQKREFEQKRDMIKKEVLDSYRKLNEAYQSYIVQVNSLKLAERRVESTDLLLQAGRATTRDLLESQEAYINAKNNLISSVADFIIETLNFFFVTEKLDVDEENGIWKGDINEILEIFEK